MKYTIVKIDDRAEKNIIDTKKILAKFEYIDNISFFDSRTHNPNDRLSSIGIRQDVWNPYDGRIFPPLPGELGVWISTINILEYIVLNKIDKILVLEDDAIISKKFIKLLDGCLGDLPDSFDFLSLSYPKEQNAFSDTTDIGSKNIHRSFNQYANATGMIYSLSGAQKILTLVKRIGIEYTSDCFIFKKSHEGYLNGYSIIPEQHYLIQHNPSAFKSLIDPDNLRETDNNI